MVGERAEHQHAALPHGAIGNAVPECELNELAPAHTLLIFEHM